MTARWQAAAFAAVCLSGAVASVALTVREATRTPDVTVVARDAGRTGNTTTIVVTVRNTTAQQRCVQVRVAARDRDGHDLAATTAASALALPARGTRQVTAHLTLTAQQYAERLHGFYPSDTPC